ncbi:MAG: response regulator [Planctomycetes bacterium]|nr:response regulator [Planctomycetota bacterium]
MSHRHFLRLADLLPEPMLLLDADGVILAANQAAGQTLSQSGDHLVGRQLASLVVGDESAVAQYLRDCVQGRKLLLSSFTGNAGDGRTVLFRCEGVLAQTAAGARAAQVLLRLTPRDAAERADALHHAIEMELLKSEERLRLALDEQKRVAEELRRAKDAAEAANRAKGEFLANISHELRTPMNAIIGMTALALEEELPPAAREQIQTVESSAAVLLELLNQILDFSRLESGHLSLEWIAFDLRETVRDAVQSLAVKAQAKGLELEYQVAPDVPDKIAGDPLRLRQVLVNLLDNAIKFTSAGRVRVDAAVQPNSRSRPALLFSVSDTGIGIAPDVQERIFAPFTQADASTTRSYGGTGLGLAISSNLVELMGGRLWVQSELGKGSTFFFAIGLSVAADAESLPRAGEGGESPFAAPHARSLRVLIAEDTPANQRLIAQILQKRGHQTDVAADGREAVAMASTHHYDVVLMDIQMPLMDGFQATHSLRALQAPGEPRLPIVAMTAHAMRGDRERCLAAGMDGYLSKPIDRAKLVETIERLAAGSYEDAWQD